MSAFRRLLGLVARQTLFARALTPRRRERKPHLEELEKRHLLAVLNPGVVVSYHYPIPANSNVTTDNPQVFSIDPANSNANANVNTMTFPRNSSSVIAANSIHDIAAGPGGVVYIAGDPDSTGTTSSDGIYKVVQGTDGSFTLVSSTIATHIAVEGNGDIIAITETDSATSGTASILQINPTTSAVTDLHDFNYTRNSNSPAVIFQDVAA